MPMLLENKKYFQRRVQLKLMENMRRTTIFPSDGDLKGNETSVLFLLGEQKKKDHPQKEICLILTKRSLSVKQPGDLCCPGGGIDFKTDSFIGGMLRLPGFPFGRRPLASESLDKNPNHARILSVLYATALREGFEEIRLVPFLVKYLGVLPAQELVMFKRTIFPMVAWARYQKRFYTNSEVEKVIHIPIRSLIKPDHYACYRLNIQSSETGQERHQIQDFPCFLHEEDGIREFLWGATYRMTMNFLDLVFHFKPPDMGELPVFNGSLDRTYLHGNSARHNAGRNNHGRGH